MRKTGIFAAQLLKKSISTKLESGHENNSQHQSKRMTQWKTNTIFSPLINCTKIMCIEVKLISQAEH